MKYRQWFTPVLLLSVLTACNNADETFMVGTLERDRIEVSVESNEPIIAIHVVDATLV